MDLPTDMTLRRFAYDPGGKPQVAKVNRCRALFHKTTLRWDGRINSCTFDLNDSSNLGDFKTSTFKEIWRGLPYRRMRKTFRKNWKEIPICTRCTYGFEGGHFTESVIESTRYELEESSSAAPPTAS